jgi:hypothetical protein
MCALPITLPKMRQWAIKRLMHKLHQQSCARRIKLSVQQRLFLRCQLRALRSMYCKLHHLFEQHDLHNLRFKLHFPQRRVHDQLPFGAVQPNCDHLRKLLHALQRVSVCHELLCLRYGLRTFSKYNIVRNSLPW